MIQANTAPFFRQQFFNSSGKPLTGGRIEFYSAGSATPKSVFADRNMTTNLGNVLQFDDAGCPAHYFMASGEYDIKIFDQFDNLVDNPLRIDASGGPSSPFPDPANPGFLHWDGATYSWIEIPMYPTPGNSGYLHYDAGTDTYSWTEITPDDGKVRVNETDTVGYLEDKLVAGHAIILETDATGPNDNVVMVSVDESQLDHTPSGPAGGDLHGFYPDPIVKQLTGIGANLVNVETDFTFDPSTYGSPNGGRGIGYGRHFVLGQETKCWVALGEAGDLHWTNDHWKTSTKDLEFQSSGKLDRPNCMHFAWMEVHNSFAWIIGQGASAFYFALHNVNNYNSNGSIKASAWTVLPFSVSNVGNPGDFAVDANNTVCFVGNSRGIGRTVDFNTFSNPVTCDSVTGGIDTDHYGNWLVIERDTGAIWESTDGEGLNWTKKTAIIVDGEAATHLPVNMGEQWGSIQSSYGLWIAAVWNVSTSRKAFAYSEDRINWTTFVDATNPAAFYSAGSDGIIWYAVNPAASVQPAIYQLMVDNIPCHRMLSCEKGIQVAGDAFLIDLPNAPFIGTDINGKIVAGQGAIGQIGDAPKVDYVFSPFDGGTRQWVPNGKASGVVENVLGPIVRDNVNHTITVPAYTVQLFDNNNFLGQPLRYQVAQSTHTISNVNVRSFVTAKYIAPGVVQTVLTPFVEDLNLSSQAPLFAVERTTYTDGTDQIHAIEFDTQGEGLAQKTTVMLTRTEPYRRSKEGGLDIASTVRRVQLTASLVFAATTPINVLAFDSALTANNLTHAYKVAGVWTYTTETSGQFNNTDYQGATDLIELGNSKWKVVWIYRSIGDDKECFYVDGTAEYNTSDEALKEAKPSGPSLIDWHCMLVGRVIIQKATSVDYIVQSAFADPFAGGTSGASGFIRNQAADGTNDSPGHIFLAPEGSVGVSESAESTYPTTLMDADGFRVQNDVVDTRIDLSGMEVHDRIEENGQHAVYGRYSANQLNFTSYLGALSSVTEDIFHFNGYDYNGLNNNYRTYQFNARLKLRVGISDTVPDELQHKFVDADGNEFPLVDTATHGKAIQIAGDGGTGVTGGFFPTMDIASAVDRVLPYLNGTRSELLVLAAPRVGYKITQGTTTKFGIAILQGGTGTIILTIRDINLRLIAQSYVRTNPSSNVLEEIDCGVVYDPATGLSVPSYQLAAGTPCYIGVNYSVNGAAYWGCVASETTNIQPVPAIRFDNLTNVPATLVVGNGSESLMRPYIRLKG